MKIAKDTKTIKIWIKSLEETLKNDFPDDFVVDERVLKYAEITNAIRDMKSVLAEREKIADESNAIEINDHYCPFCGK